MKKTTKILIITIILIIASMNMKKVEARYEDNVLKVERGTTDYFYYHVVEEGFLKYSRAEADIKNFTDEKTIFYYKPGDKARINFATKFGAIKHADPDALMYYSFDNGVTWTEMGGREVWKDGVVQSSSLNGTESFNVVSGQGMEYNSDKKVWEKDLEGFCIEYLVLDGYNKDTEDRRVFFRAV